MLVKPSCSKVVTNAKVLLRSFHQSVASQADKNQLMKTRWAKDVVYLYQFPRPATLPNISPFCVKVETFLRVHNIQYETIGNFFHRSNRGLLPFIELNGQQIADSQIILWHLQKKFHTDEGVSTDEERAMVRAIDRMVSVNTHPLLLYDNMIKHPEQMLSKPVTGTYMPGFVAKLVGSRLATLSQKKADTVLGKLTPDERKESLRQDVTAINSILGNKKFLFGDKMTIADCSVFGHIGIASFLPIRQNITDLLEDDFPLLKNYLERIRAHYFQEFKD